ncbi:hypothetical protein GBAR_LOCUS18903 [Geodia barretti]|uniref:Uncharacterized protein n=1 Tax=Geodia barretti TaxID=519541 RepID=A0AA35SPB8_GEOBA|nr:hypothetical protein GBAR_LOCUS18903 [Geodia barretti]
MYPELGAIAGYAVTCVYSVPDPNYSELSFMDVIDAMGASKQPTIFAFQQKFPPEFENKYLLSGITPGHGAMAVHAVNVPVSIAGMDVAPGEIIHMDENGACKFPADKLEAVLTNVKALLEEEGDRIGKLLSGPKTAKQVRAIFSGHSYAEDEEE